MINLLSHRLTARQISAMIPSARTGTLHEFGHASWHDAANDPRLANLVNKVIAAARAELHRPMPELNDDLYTEFSRTGRRLGFEAPYFERRRLLGQSAIAALVDTSGATEDLQDTLNARLSSILDEDSWALPAHVYNPTGRDSKYIDLFAAETAYTLAELTNVFSAVIPQDLQLRVLQRVRATVFEPYIDHADSFHFTHDTHNWNAVCHQGVVGAALLLEPEAKTVGSILEIASTRLRRFLEGFTPDGGCTEGPGYWQYGFGRFTALNQLLETITNRELSLFTDDERIPLIAQYPLNVILADGYVANFSDCAQRMEFDPWLMDYLGNRLKLKALNAIAHETFARVIETDPSPTAADFYQLSRLITMLPHAGEAENKGMVDTLLPDLQVLCVHRRDCSGKLWELAAKAGHNAEHHNHNDCGSYLLNIASTPIITELGSPEYTREFFGPTRYSFLAARSAGHSVPIVNGIEQAAGVEYRSRLIRCDVTAHTILFEVDLTACYPKEAKCKSLVREILLDAPAAWLQITDRFVLTTPASVETAIMLADGDILDRGDDLLITIGAVPLKLTPGPDCAVSSIERLKFRPSHGSEITVHRVRLRAAAPATEGVLQYTLTSGSGE